MEASLLVGCCFLGILGAGGSFACLCKAVAFLPPRLILWQQDSESDDGHDNTNDCDDNADDADPLS